MGIFPTLSDPPPTPQYGNAHVTKKNLRFIAPEASAEGACIFREVGYYGSFVFGYYGSFVIGYYGSLVIGYYGSYVTGYYRSIVIFIIEHGI